VPKVLVLYHGRDLAALADAVAEGARAVRFTEVDVRRVDDVAGPAAAHRSLGSEVAPADYDGILLGAPAGSGAAAAAPTPSSDPAEVLRRRGPLVDRVGAAFTAGARDAHQSTLSSILTAMAGLGMLLVPPGPGPAPSAADSPLGTTASAAEPTEAELDAARRHGRRVATVVEWVAHARGHAAHGHHHHH